jgi:putative PIN family toxin of toxin-antitoxin system
MSTVVPESLRVVLDTNVLVSAFTHNRSLSFQIWQKAIDRRFRLLLTADRDRTCGRPSAEILLGDARILSEMKFLVKTAEIVVPRLTLRVVPEDDDDNRILECAVAGNAGLVVSGDYHLRKLKSYHGIGIVTPIDFRRMLGV